jgi:hypothetical protein
MNTQGTQQQTNGRWEWKITIYSWSGIAASIALLKYKEYGLNMEQPLCKLATDKYCNRSIAMYYFRSSAAARAMWEALKFVGKKYNHDAYLCHYDWDENRLEQIEEQSHHNYEREE